MTFLSLHLFLLSALSLPFCLMSDEKIFVFLDLLLFREKCEFGH